MVKFVQWQVPIKNVNLRPTVETDDATVARVSFILSVCSPCDMWSVVRSTSRAIQGTGRYRVPTRSFRASGQQGKIITEEEDDENIQFYRVSPETLEKVQGLSDEEI